ncbi:MAG: hypothetical protein MZU95_02935 [Desulfomicrobium escambiense]|nr:hypothetical protein [Desulfomicrobium escambiense]
MIRILHHLGADTDKSATEKQQDAIITNAAAAAKSGRIHALGTKRQPGRQSVTLGGASAELKRHAIEPLVHFACRDKNRNAIESMLYSLERSKAHNRCWSLVSQLPG